MCWLASMFFVSLGSPFRGRGFFILREEGVVSYYPLLPPLLPVSVCNRKFLTFSSHFSSFYFKHVLKTMLLRNVRICVEAERIIYLLFTPAVPIPTTGETA
jgi:hypothetical protein